MPDINLQTTKAHQRAMDDYQHSRPFLSEFENQGRLYTLAAHPGDPQKYAVATGIVHCLALLSLISNSVYVCEANHRNSIPRSDIDFAQRLPPSAATSPSSDLLSNLSVISADILSGGHRGLVHLSQGTVRLADNVFTAIATIIKKYDFIPLLPGAVAHVRTETKEPITLSPGVEKDDVSIQKLDFSCAEERNTLSYANVLRQIGKTLKNPITELVNESQIIHQFNTLRAGCPSAENTEKLTAITLRVDNILSAITSFVPYLNQVTLVQSIGGPLLQLIADDIEDRNLDDDDIETITEQITFLAKSTIDISPRETNGSGRINHLEFPENIYSENNKIFTTIENNSWQLIFRENRYFATHHSDLREVVYSHAERRWVFVHDSKHNPVTATLLQRLHQLGPEGLAQRGGVNHVARDYLVEPDALSMYIKDDAKLSSEGLKLIAAAEIDQPHRAPSTLDKFYDRWTQSPDKIPSHIHSTRPAPRHASPNLPIKNVITLPEEAPKIEEGRLKGGDTPSHASQPATVETHDAPSQTQKKMKTRPRRILHVKRDKLTNLVRQLEGMGRTGITDAGGLAKIAMKNDVPLKDLERYIRADGTLSESGKHLLNPKPQKAVYQSRQSPARKKTDIHASTEQENHIIEPHKGILKLITRHGTVSSEITLKGNIEGATHPLIYNLEQDVFYPAVRYANKAWIRGSDTPYIANENSEELTVLPESQRDRVVSHRQRTASLKALGNELDLVRLANRQAENPPRTAIPHKISSIWVGTNTIPLHLMTNLARNARIAMSGRYPFEFTLYLSRQNPKAFTHNHSILSHIAPGIKMLTLEDTVFYEKFKQSKYYEQYHAAIDGNGGVATNFASAADVVRFPLMEEEGGIYMDVDDALVAAPSSIPLETTPEGFILHPPMDNEKLGMSYQYPTSVFGTHKNNPTLGKISEEIYNRYQENKDIYLSRPPHGNTQEFDTYAKRISYLSGPTMFDSVIGKECQGEKQILEAQRLMRYPLDKIENDPLHQMMSTLYENDITQLDDIAQVGSENSWVHSRK